MGDKHSKGARGGGAGGADGGGEGTTSRSGGGESGGGGGGGGGGNASSAAASSRKVRGDSARRPPPSSSSSSASAASGEEGDAATAVDEGGKAAPGPTTASSASASASDGGDAADAAADAAGADAASGDGAAAAAPAAGGAAAAAVSGDSSADVPPPPVEEDGTAPAGDAAAAAAAGTAAGAAAGAAAAAAAAEDADSIPLDLRPDDIVVGEFLGDGVYSEVFKGQVYGTPVAVKKFRAQGFDPNVLKEVRKEVRIMRSIRHPNLLLFLGACTEPGQLMIVTELLECSFHDLVGQGVPLFEKLVMAKEAAKGLSWLHSLTPVIIHRDLKPENILVGANRSIVKVADFGLSLVRDYSSAMAEEMRKIRGSPAFMSPEALLAKELTPATDVYSFGMIMWELITEGSAYDDLRIESFEQLIAEICDKHTRERLPADTVPALRRIIEASWSGDPAARPTFIDVIAGLDDAILEHAIEDPNGRHMWERCFKRGSQGLEFEVPWEKFKAAFEYHVDVEPSAKLVQAVQAMLGVAKDPARAGQNKVHARTFGNLLKWLGPMEALNANRPENSILSRMQRLFTYRWFHGDISVEQAETRLAEAEPGTFLIRFSSVPGQWALSKAALVDDDPNPKLLHIRIQYRIIVPTTAAQDGGAAAGATEDAGGATPAAGAAIGEYAITLDGETHRFASLPELVQADVLDLKKPCPGSKYYAQFRIKNDHLGYVNQLH